MAARAPDPGLADPGIRALLAQNRPLAQLLAAHIPSDLADWFNYVAIAALLAYVWQVETPVFALLAVAMGLPFVVIGPLAGMLADRCAETGDAGGEYRQGRDHRRFRFRPG